MSRSGRFFMLYAVVMAMWPMALQLVDPRTVRGMAPALATGMAGFAVISLVAAVSVGVLTWRRVRRGAVRA